MYSSNGIASEPKSSPYSTNNGGVTKPVPPPKPKSYPNYNTNAKNYQHSTSLYSNSRNGIPDDDSGQGSSLDRDYGIYNNEPRYANPPAYYSMGHDGGNTQPPPNAGSGGQSQADLHQLDLTNNREYRGSAFELYKKPMHMATNSPQQYQNSVW